MTMGTPAVLVATIVQWSELIETIVASILAGIGVTFAYSVAIWGFGRSLERSRENRTVAAGSAAAVGVAALLTVLAAVVIGIVVMASK